jgi:hypothetical protein
LQDLSVSEFYGFKDQGLEGSGTAQSLTDTPGKGPSEATGNGGDNPKGPYPGNGPEYCAHCHEPIDLVAGHTATSDGKRLHNRCVDEWGRDNPDE